MRVRYRLGPALVLAILGGLSGVALAGPDFQTYRNARFGYSIDYPAALLRPQGEAENGDGQRFLSPDGAASLLVYGAYNVLERSLEDLYREAVRGDANGGAARTLTYRVLKPGWFVVSGLAGETVFYQKTVRDGERLVSFVLEYPAAERDRFDPIVARLARSLKP